MNNQNQSFNIDPNNPMSYSSNSNATNNTSNLNNPLNQEKLKENQKNHKRFNYLVSLQKKHIVIGSCVVMLMFLVFFMMGFFFGYQSNEEPTNDYAKTSSDQSSTVKASSFAINNVPINTESKIDFTQGIASDELLRKDNPLSSLTRSKQKRKKVNTKNTDKSVKSKLVDITPIAGEKYYYIQVIATSFVDKAKNIYFEFKKRNYPVKVQKNQKEGKDIYQIRLGLYQRKARALRHLKQVKNVAGFKKAVLIRYRF